MARLQIMLYNEETGEQIILPIAPEQIDLTHSKQNATFNIKDYGEVNVMGDRNLMRISLAHFLPEEDLFVQIASIITNTSFNAGYSADKAIEMLRKWEDNSARIRVVIDREANKVFDIISFTETVRENSNMRPYSLELIEYRNPKEENKLVPEINGLYSRVAKGLKVPVDKLAVAGDTIYTLAKRYGVDFKSLALKNGINDYNLDIGGKLLDFIGVNPMV